MRLGVVGMMPGSLDEVDRRLARNIADLGFTGVGMHLVGDPTAVPDDVARKAKAVLEEQGIRMIQFWGWYPSIISPDESIRAEGVRVEQEIIRLGSKIGAAMIGLRPTSLNPRGVWWPHPDNYLPETEDRLVRSLREIAKVCEETGIPITLECHTVSTLKSPAIVRRIIEKTESPWVKFTLDPVNFVKDLDTAFNTTPLINDLFDELGPYISSAHIKDVYVEDRHVVHISETIPGDGIFDFDTFFRRFEALAPDAYGLVEHLPEAQIPQAAAFVIDKLRELNIPII